ncbi:MAG: LiaI-LiaF-like domain-containing protein [Bryobacteraceae bacterium]
MNDDRAARWAERQARRDARRQRHGLTRSIRGPVMLITVGVLFALQNFTPYGFEQTWPVLLVVAGLLSLLGRVAAPPPPPVNPAAPPPYPPYTWPTATPPPPPAGDYRGTTYSQGPYAQTSPPPNEPGAQQGGAK